MSSFVFLNTTGLALLMFRISSRISGAMPGRLGLRHRLFHAQYRLNPQRRQRTTVSTFHDDIEGTGNSREFKRFLSLTHVLLVVAIIIWEGRLRLY